jgi:hypothetical protein
MLVSAVAIANSPIKLIVNGAEVVSDVPPQIIDGHTMIPARPLAEALGAKVEWDAENYAVVVTGGVQAGAVPTDLEAAIGDVVEKNRGDMGMWEINGLETEHVIMSNAGICYIFVGTLKTATRCEFIFSFSNDLDKVIVNDNWEYGIVDYDSSASGTAVKKDNRIYISLQKLQEDGALNYQINSEQKQITIAKAS